MERARSRAIIGGDREREHPPTPGRSSAAGRRVVGVAFANPAVDLCDLALELVDQLDRRRDVARQGSGRRVLRAGCARGPEQVGDREG